MSKTVLILGASRGLGRELAKLFQEKNYTVIGTYRNKKAEELKITWESLDLQNEVELKRFLEKNKQIDILINNAAIYIDDYRKGYGEITNLTIDDLKETLAVNYIPAFMCIQSVLPEMLKKGYGRIINISSGMGRLDQFDKVAYAYRTSKLLLNTLTISFSQILEEKDGDIAITSICPGWMKTDMGTQDGKVDPRDAAMEVIKIIMKNKNEINGKFYRDGMELSFIQKKG